MRITAFAAVPVILAGGAVATARLWSPGGTTGGTTDHTGLSAYVAADPDPTAQATARPAPPKAAAESTAEKPLPAPEATTAAASRPHGAATPRADRPEKTPTAKDDKPEKAKGGKKAGASPKPGEEPADRSPDAWARGDVLGASDLADGEPLTSLYGLGDPGGGAPADGSGTARPDDTGPVTFSLVDPSGAAGDAPGRTEPDGTAATPRAGRSKYTDVAAMEYFQARWGAKDAAMKKVTDIRSVGGYLRIYTTLKDNAINHKHAVTLCERGRDYLAKERGVRHPVVFVHARTGLNGNPVLANDLGQGDKDCRLTTPRPGRGAKRSS
ncbi:hypothetical protein [Thermopolyspora flexuosa]|uniref:hypothetical protein n=1 Tax=Thermopolyspora flexuosa TaxID=103836 RepID=UPI00114DB406|nr:hypothetical protein [Thermopolyspora flexuosa]